MRQSTSTVFVALLRGVNVGGNNMISMSSLKKSFESMGFTERSHLHQQRQHHFQIEGSRRTEAGKENRADVVERLSARFQSGAA